MNVIAPGRARRVTLLAAAVVAVVVAVAVSWWPRASVVRVFEQPAGVTYTDGSVHVAVLRHVRAPVAASGLAPDSFDRYEVVLGRDPGGDYGHLVRLEATGSDPAELRVDWAADGAWLTYTSGHRVFVPASSFTGGR